MERRRRTARNGVWETGGFMSEQMLKLAKEKIEFAYADAIERKIEDPAVFVLDVRDKGALWLAERITDRSQIDALILESDKGATMPVLTLAVSRKQATLLLGAIESNRAHIP
jgi:rhodanese-related sulfurtransferase